VDGYKTGIGFRKETLDVCNEFGLTPNKSKKTYLDSVELEKPAHQEYWVNELSKLSKINQLSFINGWLKCIDGNEHDSSYLFKQSLDFTLLRKEIVKILYSGMVKERKFDKFIILGNGSNAKILSNDNQQFNQLIDSNYIRIGSDFFRINQRNNIGWYIS
jgi:hypothetical protein